MKLIKKSVADENTQTPAMRIIATTQSLRDIITLMKRSKTFFSKFEEKPTGDVFWNGVFFQPLGERESRLKMKNIL